MIGNIMSLQLPEELAVAIESRAKATNTDPTRVVVAALELEFGLSYDLAGSNTDIMECKPVEEASQQWERYFKSSVEVQRQLLVNRDNSHNYDAILEQLGSISDASRVYIVECHHNKGGELIATQHARWCADNTGNVTEKYLPIEDMFPRWIERLEQGDIISGIVANFPHAEREILHSQGILSILVVPLIINGEFSGFIGVENCNQTRQWQQSDITLLQSVALAISLKQERLLAQIESEKALEQEKELRQLKSRFISLTSHEFRTPLTIIQSSAELLEHYQWSAQEKRDLFEQIYAALRQMSQLSEDVMWIGKTEAGRLLFNPQLMDVVRFCQAFMTELKLSMGKQNSLTFISHCQCCLVALDEKLLRHILDNLLSNAVKYSPLGHPIHLELACEEGEVILQVRDQGIGISSQDKQQLFEYFHRGKNVGAIPGTGLGLAMVKKCVDLHGGQIFVESELNVGTTFTVKLPVNLNT